MDARIGGADFLQLSPASAPVRGLASWLADAVRAAIIDGRLPAGAPLPPTRVLADDLGISRGVIVEAYQRLADEGLVSARRRAGTRVLGLRPANPGQTGANGSGGRAAGASGDGPGGRAAGASGDGPGARADPGASGDGPRGRADPGRLPLRWRGRAEIDLSPGVPDLSGFPRAAWLRAERAVLERASVADPGYGDPRGSEWLRAELAGWLARTRGCGPTWSRPSTPATWAAPHCPS